MPPRPTVRQERAAAWLALPDRDQLTMAEAAHSLGCGEHALKSALSRARRDGVLPATTIRKPGPIARDDSYILEEWEFLRGCGVHWEEAATRLGVEPRSFKRIINNRRPS